ncbi:MAG: M4 family metallopeptidase, partial [Cyclobacteriaceae bacterium]|nr:M4 family metallopeptidase [Cyclobacteriaceae bacterium]
MYLIKLPGKHLKLKHLLPFCLLFGYLLVSFYSISQVLEENYPVVNSRRNSDGTYSFIRFAPDKGMKRPLTLSSANLEDILNLPKNHELKLQANNNFKGNSELIFEEYFKGIPIAFSRLKLKTSNGQIISIAGRYYEISENTPITPRISESVAFEKAIAYLNAKQYSWEFDGIIEPELKTLPKGSLVLMERINETNQSLTNRSSSFSLCFKFKIYTIEPLSYSEIFVDADNGNILFNNPILKHGDGIGDTKYSGRRNLKTLKFGGNFVLVDSSRTNPLHTLNLNRGFNYNLATDFTDKDDQWTEAEFNNPAQNQAALDAHWGAEKTFEFFKRKFNRNGFDGKGSLLKSYVHAGLKFSNAFWDGFSVTYGDGDSVYYGPFTSIDICAHEIGHAICQYSANLIYFRESGAINESLSDIWGACVKNYAAPEKNHWLYGDEVSLKNDFIRSFINPKAKGQPDTYKGENWYNGDFDNGGVHINSGVMNYWFYLLSTGKNGTNDNGFNYQVMGIGIEKASQIVYRALTEYLYPTAQMIDARYTTIIAAIDIFGDNSNEVRQVIAAWDAVGVMENLPAPSALNISDSSSYIKLSWNYPLFVSDFNGFIIERQTGAFGNFVEIGRVGAEEKSYSDFDFTPDSLLKYRVRAFKGNMISDWVVGFVSQGDGPLVMRNGTFTFCRKQFLDPGGSLPYKNNSIITTTIRPSFSGGRVGVRFYRFFLENQVDFLEIYNGSSINSPRLGVFTGKNIPGLLRSSDTSGALTFRFRSSNFITDSGWIAEFDCADSLRIRPVIRDVVFDSVNRGARLNWVDVGSKEISYIIERAVNDFGNNSFIEIGRVNQNETTFVDTTIPINTTVFYRVVANYIADTVIGFTRSFTYGAFPYIMRNGTFDSTCSKTFLDPGGLGNYSASNTNGLQTVVLIPRGKDTKIELNFSRFKLFNTDYLNIYNGFGVNKTLIATYYGYSAKPGKIRSTSADGRLTVEFFRHSSSPGDSGWVANIGCYSFISQPDIVSVLPVGNSATNLEISWIDRSDIEDFYIVQRALNDTTSLAFKTVSILPANTTSFIDNIPQQDGVYSYRIIGVSNKDTTLSRTVTYNAGNHPVLMTDKLQVVTCDKVFMDPAGLGLYSQPSNSRTITTTFLPANPGDRLMVDFSVLKLANGDLLSASREGGHRIILGGIGSSSLPNRFKSKNTDGSITFYFDQSASGNSDLGWVGKISCYKPVQAPIIDSVVPANPKGIKIYWNEASNNATGYIIQRSINDSTNRYMKTIATVSSDTFSFEDTSNIMNAWAFYRIIAFNDSDSSLSLSKGLLVGNEPKAMVDEEHIVSCDLTLLDMGGIGDYPFFLDKSFQKTVVIPDGEDRKLSVELLQIKLNRGEYLRFYDGNTVSSAYLIGEFTEGDTIPTTLKSKLGDGTITVSYENFFGGMNYGAWEARFTCYETILSPRLNEASITGSGIELNWVDRS